MRLFVEGVIFTFWILMFFADLFIFTTLGIYVNPLWLVGDLLLILFAGGVLWSVILGGIKR